MLSLEQILEGVVVPIDKPRQWSSFQVVGKVRSVVRQLYGVKKFKIGHAGTLDPLATGLLLVCIGKATKRIEQLQQHDKVYTGTMVIGATTPCFDLERPIDAYYPYDHITRSLLSQAARQQIGTIMQMPPLFSAAKVDGQRAYDIGRSNLQTGMGDDEVAAMPRSKEVQIFDFQITAFREGNRQAVLPPLTPMDDVPQVGLYANPQGIVPEALPQCDFRVHCGKGTYIRSVVRDLGASVGSGAFLASLRRERVGEYDVADAWSPVEVSKFFEGEV